MPLNRCINSHSKSTVMKSALSTRILLSINLQSPFFDFVVLSGSSVLLLLVSSATGFAVDFSSCVMLTIVFEETGVINSLTLFSAIPSLKKVDEKFL